MGNIKSSLNGGMKSTVDTSGSRNLLEDIGYIEWGKAHTLSNFTRVIAAVIWLDAG
jgi:hypothetical protein